MGKIFIEKKEIKFKVKESVVSTTFDVVDGKYVENTQLSRKYISDIYQYLDFNVLFAMENLFDEYYIKIILFNDDKQIGYNLVSLSNNLDISVKRVSPKNFLVLGINKDQETQGQASFCSLQNDGSVNEVTYNFNYINQYKVIEHKYFLLNYIETVKIPSDDDIGKEDKFYFNTIGVYRDDGTILTILVEERLRTKRELVCDIDKGMLIIYYKDDGSVVKKTSISEILLTKNEEDEDF
ncbi:MAG: hypothetical protein IJX17_03680 [Clostridia bacterium]|nr:hypothetical protein [Clostridia bacterium]